MCSTGSDRQIERKTPWSHLDLGQIGPALHLHIITDLAARLGMVGRGVFVEDTAFEQITLEAGATVAGRGVVDGAVEFLTGVKSFFVRQDATGTSDFLERSATPISERSSLFFVLVRVMERRANRTSRFI
jgi:hypothetical protein